MTTGIKGFQKGSVPWNKGLTKETSTKVESASKKSAMNRKGKLYKSTYRKGYPPWNKGNSKYQPIDYNILISLSQEQHLYDNEIAKIVGTPAPYISNLRHKFNIRRVEKWEKWPITRLSETEIQVIIGSLLGDGHGWWCTGHTHASLTSVQHNTDYLEWKYLQLKNWVLSPLGQRHSFNTICHPVFDKIVREFYPNGKKIIPIVMLNKLTPLGLAVWYMDDGSYQRSQYIKKSGEISIYKGCQLSTDCFSFAEHLLLQDWFINKFNIKPSICKQGRNFHLVFPRKATETLFEIIQEFIIPSMQYKLGFSREENLAGRC